MSALPTVSQAMNRLHSWSNEAKDLLELEDKTDASGKTAAFCKEMRQEMIEFLGPENKKKYGNDPVYQTIVEFFLSMMNRAPAQFDDHNYRRFLFNVQDYAIVANNRLNLMKEGKDVLLF